MEIGTDGHELRGRTTVAEYDDSLALEIDTLIPLGRVNDPSPELGRVERCVGRVREGPDGTDKHVASLECRLVRLEILDFEGPDRSLARERCRDDLATVLD